MSKSLYVGHLSSKLTEADLKANLSAAGNILSVRIIRDTFSGMSKGFGFIEMESEEEAREAITKFNGSQLDGQTIVVGEARPNKDHGGGNKKFIEKSRRR
jgi:RNA recognition motif-containing protein